MKSHSIRNPGCPYPRTFIPPQCPAQAARATKAASYLQELQRAHLDTVIKQRESDAVSPISKSAGHGKLGRAGRGECPAGLEIRETADSEACATATVSSARLRLPRFLAILICCAALTELSTLRTLGASGMYTPLGQAGLTNVGTRLLVSNIGSSGQDDMAVHLGEAQFGVVSVEVTDPNQAPDGAEIQARALGMVNGQPGRAIITLRAVAVPDGWELRSDFSPLGTGPVSALIYDGMEAPVKPGPDGSYPVLTPGRTPTERGQLARSGATRHRALRQVPARAHLPPRCARAGRTPTKREQLARCGATRRHALRPVPTRAHLPPRCARAGRTPTERGQL